MEDRPAYTAFRIKRKDALAERTAYLKEALAPAEL